MDAKTKGTQKLAKVTDQGRFEVVFKMSLDGSVSYATIENGRTVFSGKLKDWKEAAAAWDNLVAKGYVKEKSNI